MLGPTSCESPPGRSSPSVAAAEPARAMTRLDSGWESGSCTEWRLDGVDGVSHSWETWGLVWGPSGGRLPALDLDSSFWLLQLMALELVTTSRALLQHLSGANLQFLAFPSASPRRLLGAIHTYITGDCSTFP